MYDGCKCVLAFNIRPVRNKASYRQACTNDYKLASYAVNLYLFCIVLMGPIVFNFTKKIFVQPLCMVLYALYRFLVANTFPIIHVRISG